MDELFGAPIASVAIVLAVLFALLSSVLLYTVLRNPILARMGVRNVARRPARAALIVVGLMLATAIISSAFTTGDSITFSIKREILDSLRFLDMTLTVDEDSDVWEGSAVPEDFSQETFAEFDRVLTGDSDIDGVLPSFNEAVAIVNLEAQQFEVSGLLSGLDPERTAAFGTLLTGDGMLMDLASLGPDEAYVDLEGAEALAAGPGDVLGVAIGPGQLHMFTVKGVVDGWYTKRPSNSVVLMVPLKRAQELLGKEGRLSSILISNRGDELAGEALTPRIMERLGDLPAMKEAGLELFPLKQDLIAQANQIGNLFVSFFTTFGLFSIGVGLLLIFLIFSMLAAERKSELGMARAVGMQRRHLIRMFMVEGATYGVGSSVVGAAVGVGIGYLLVIAVSSLFEQEAGEGFMLTPHVEATSLVVSFLIGGVITLATVAFSSRRVSRLNIVRAIRDIPDPEVSRAGRSTLIWGLVISVLGVLATFAGFQGAQLSLFSLGVSLIPIGVSMVLRWRGVSQRWVLSGVGLLLLVYWLLPPAVMNWLKDDWNQDFSVFFLSGAMVVTGAVLLTMNNAPIVLALMTGTVGRIRRFTPVVKSAVSYPLRFRFRTGLSVAMFAVVIFSVVVMSTFIEGFSRLFQDQQRLGGGYEVMAFAASDLNPVDDLASTVEGEPDLGFVTRVDGAPSVGTFRTIRQADAVLGRLDDGEPAGDDYQDTTVTGVDADFLATNQFEIKLATSRFATDSGFDSAAVWRALAEEPGLAVASALILPRRNSFAFDVLPDMFMLDVEGLFLENETMDPVTVTVRDLTSGTALELTVIAVLDDFVSQGPYPIGLYAATDGLKAEVNRDIAPTQFFFNVSPGADDAAKRIEKALFRHGLETLDIAETLADLQAANRAFFNLLIAFMTLGLVVGTAGLGVISARAVVERRQQIGVLRAIGFSRGMIQLTFLAESSFIALLGIALGIALGVVVSINGIADTRTDEPNIQLIIPWGRILVIGLGAYLFSLLATYLPSRQAGRMSPAAALRYE